MKNKIIVVKVGTRILTDNSGRPNLVYIKKIVQQISDLKKRGHKILLVSSGAIGMGIGKLNLSKKPTILEKKQALAAIGQSSLIHFYEKLFLKHKIIVAQVLLTREDLGERKKYLKSKNTLTEILKYGALPIINENDTVATEEIEFGDNDTLSALVASLIGADLLIILSNVNGLYSDNPKNSKNKKIDFISYIPEITKEIMGIASSSPSHLGTGGMLTKIEAAKIATDSGVTVIIANGQKEKILNSIIKGEKVGTYIPAKKTVLSLQKRWLLYGLPSQCAVIIDKGAEKMIINSGKSLLPSGIIAIVGSFSSGEMVEIKDIKSNIIARGLINYNSFDLNKIKGLKSKNIINQKNFVKIEAIHRNKLVLNSKYRK